MPDFAALPENRPSVPNSCDLDKLLSEILHDAFCIFIDYNS